LSLAGKLFWGVTEDINRADVAILRHTDPAQEEGHAARKFDIVEGLRDNNEVYITFCVRLAVSR